MFKLDYIDYILENSKNRLNEIDVSHIDERIIYWLVDSALVPDNFFKNVVMWYNEYEKKLFVFKEEIMINEICIELPYGELRKESSQFIYEVDRRLGKDNDEVLLLAAYNNFIDGLNKSQLYLYISNYSEELYKYILSEVNNNRYKIRNEFNYKTMLRDQKNNLLNITSGTCNSSEEWLNEINKICIYKEMSEYTDYFNNPYIKEKKTNIFISYCHKDYEVVSKVEKILNYQGIHYWIDKKDIFYGKNILDVMNEGIENSDLALIFISDSFVKSAYGNYELNSFWNDVIQSNKEWIIVNVDNAEIASISRQLLNYKYYSLNSNEESSIKELANIVYNKIKEIQ